MTWLQPFKPGGVNDAKYIDCIIIIDDLIVLLNDHTIICVMKCCFCVLQLQLFFCLQIFVSNSSRSSDQQIPFGYLKASSSLTTVNMFIMPYNYPVLLPLLG